MNTDIANWKDGEYAYCASLVRCGGNREVPSRAISSYLDVQIASALRDQRIDVAEALNALRATVTP